MIKSLLLVPLALTAMTALASAAPPGSYRQSCDNIRQRGPFLMADCDTPNGDSRQSSLDLRGCRGGINNTYGRLTCDRASFRGDDEDRPRRGPPRFDDRDHGFDGPMRHFDRPRPGFNPDDDDDR